VKYLLDTGTLSYLASRRPKVVAHFEEHAAVTAVAAVAWQEKHYGLLRLQPGRLRDALREFLATFGRPILPYDERAALWHAEHRAKRRKDGNDAMVLPSRRPTT
jgi:predicted nucleic acid-binding protein